MSAENLAKLLIRPKTTVKEALRRMDEAGEKILFVTDPAGKLLGTVTDGDIRRHIIRSCGIKGTIHAAMNRRPKSLQEGYDLAEARALMTASRIECIPVVDAKKRIISAIWWIDLFEQKRAAARPIKLPVVIMAGGEGTRLFPYTRVLPKPLMLINDTPIIELIIDKFCEHGCADFYLSVNYKSNIIKAYFSDFDHPYRINFVQEKKPLGTGGSLHLLKKKFSSEFFLSNCDIFIDADYADIHAFHKKNGNDITVVGSMKHYTIPYGVLELSPGGSLAGLSEKPEYDFLVNTGLYVLEPRVLELVPENKFYNLTQLLEDCRGAGGRVGVYPISERSWFDMGEWETLQSTAKRIGVKSA